LILTFIFRYTESAKLLYKTYRDRPIHPLDEAIYWTEYVMRYKGAPHLQSAAKDLNFFQYHSLDVIGSILLIVLFLKLFLWHIVVKRCMCRGFFINAATKKSKKRSKKNN